jgi:hypothetical protein
LEKQPARVVNEGEVNVVVEEVAVDGYSMTALGRRPNTSGSDVNLFNDLNRIRQWETRVSLFSSSFFFFLQLQSGQGWGERLVL